MKPLVAIDADVLGRSRTGDETYVANLLRELARSPTAKRLAAVTRRPDLVPEGIEAVELAAGVRAYASPYACQAFSVSCGRHSPISCTSCRPPTAAEASSPCRTSRSIVSPG